MRRLLELTLASGVTACWYTEAEWEAALAAADTSDDPFGDTDTDADADAELYTHANLSLSWSGDGVEVTIDGKEDAWGFGMAETSAGADGWYGESCIDGDEPDGYDDYGFDACHTLADDGGSVLTVAGIDDVEDGQTLFYDAMGDAGNITYVLFALDDADPCYVWGDSVPYYEAWRCETPRW